MRFFIIFFLALNTCLSLTALDKRALSSDRKASPYSLRPKKRIKFVAITEKDTLEPIDVETVLLEPIDVETIDENKNPILRNPRERREKNVFLDAEIMELEISIFGEILKPVY